MQTTRINPTPILCSEIAKNSTLFGSSSQSSAFSPWLPLLSCRLLYIGKSSHHGPTTPGFYLCASRTISIHSRAYARRDQLDPRFSGGRITVRGLILHIDISKGIY